MSKNTTTKNESAKCVKENKLTDAQQKKLIKMMKDAGMPVVMSDKDFKLGARELDIRKLAKENQIQMLFRMCCHAVTYTKTLHDDLVDVMKLVMLLVKKSGYLNITEAVTELELSLAKEVQQGPEAKEKQKA